MPAPTTMTTQTTQSTQTTLTASRDYFAALYERSDDPWRIAGNWYEQRKRSLIMAMLPRGRFRHAFEPACGSGELTVDLGRRCDRILAGDFAQAAVDIAHERWQQASISRRTECVARFACMAVPHQWPAKLGGVFDLIVISEFAYYLDDEALRALPVLVNASLAPDGVLVLCHWKRDFAQRRHRTADIHQGFENVPDWHHAARYEDADFLLDLWSREKQSLAELAELI